MRNSLINKEIVDQYNDLNYIHDIKNHIVPLSHENDIKNNIVPLFYDNDIDTTNLINIILIHDQVYDFNNFFKYVNLKSYPIVYNSKSSLSDLHNLLKEKFLNINRVSFIFHDAGINQLKDFFNNESLFTYNDLTDNVDKYSNNLQFIIDLVKEFNIKNLDYLACNTLQYENWNKYYNIIHKETNVIIGASNDLTGNIKYGGNWVLESTNEDIRNIYFTEDIKEYQYTLATTFLSQNGGTYYFRQVTSTSLIEYSSNNSTWTQILNTNWPLQITNSSPSSSNVLTVQFNTDITIGSSIGTNGYFIINSQYIEVNGNNKVVTINGVTNYLGLIRNGTSSNNGYTNISIEDLGVVTSNGSTLGIYGGWIGQEYFGRNISSGTISVTNCYSTGNIGSEAGGIFGFSTGYSSSGGTITATNCYSTGNINSFAGGIFGSDAGQSSSGGSVTSSYCYSTGTIGSGAGGIFGGFVGELSSGGTIKSSNCYSTGTIGSGAGGIFGQYTGYSSSGGTITSSNCYSTGNIGSEAGGIFGEYTGYSSSGGTITSSNCYSTGNIGFEAGGIFGAYSGNLATGTSSIAVTNSYSAGVISTPGNGIFGSYKTLGTETFTYSANANWNNSTANSNLNISTNVWYVITSTPNIPYLLNSFGYNNLSYNIEQNVERNTSTKIILKTIGDNIGTYTIFTQPLNGTLSLVSGSNITYTPNIDFSGYDTFSYYNNSGKAVVNITVGIYSTILTQSLINSYTFPIYILSDSVITINENLDITGNINKYFVISGNNISINGNNKVITINGIINYPGLIQNGTSSKDGYTNISIKDLGVVTSNGSTLVDEGGWIGQNYFGNSISNGIISVTNCYSTGIISVSGGGIFGRYTGYYFKGGSIMVSECYSTGNIGSGAGGIFGRTVGYIGIGGIIKVNDCYSTGNIGTDAGGIFGALLCSGFSEGSIIVSNCYSTGNIGNNAGGIFGYKTGVNFYGGSITSSNCYSTGNIGSQAGGIFGSYSGQSSSGGTIKSSNCYSTGNIGSQAGGIFGAYSGYLATGTSSITVTNSYSSGIISTPGNGIFGSYKTLGTETFTYSADGNWNNSTANSNLNIPSNEWYVITSTPNIPYLINSFGYNNLSYNIVQSIVLNTSSQITLKTIGDNIGAYTIFTQPLNGVLSNISGSTLTYTPNNNFSGYDSFIYYNNSGKAVVNITVGIESTILTQSLINSYTFPIYILADSVITISEPLDISGNVNKYFVIGGNNVSINGNSKIVTINGIINYLGLIQNGTSSKDGYTNISIKDLGVVTSNGSTLGIYGGWIGQEYFGRNISSGTISVTNCYSTGVISNSGGGIFGYGAGQYSSGGTITATNCYTIGTINISAGGIFGFNTGQSSSGGTIKSINCYSTGNINSFAGGIFGQFTGQSSSGGSVTSSNCYSTGSIGTSAGGIFGQGTGQSSTGGTITATNCYTIGTINTSAGGIFGQSTGSLAKGTTSITAQNCYTIGAIITPGNGIFGSNKSTSYGTSTFCIFVGGSTSDLALSYTTQLANIWIDNNATLTIKRNDTTPSKWIDYSPSTNVPWLLSSFNDQIYITDPKTLIYGNDGTSDPGLFTPNYTYSMISNSQNTSFININGSTGVLTFSKILSLGEYTISVLVGKINTGVYYAYNTNIYTLYVRISQTIIFSTIDGKTYGDLPYNLNGISSSGLPLTYTSSDTSVATISGITVTIVGVGTTIITASQSGNYNYSEAPNVEQTLTVKK